MRRWSILVSLLVVGPLSGSLPRLARAQGEEPEAPSSSPVPPEAHDAPLSRGPSKRLDVLRAEYHGTRDDYLKTIVKRDVLEQRLRPLAAEHAARRQLVERLQDQEPGLVRDQQLQNAKLELKRVSTPFAKALNELNGLLDAEKSLRFQLKLAGWALINRLFVKADDLDVISRAGGQNGVNRSADAVKYRQEALEVLDEVGALEELNDDPPAKISTPPVDERTPTEELLELRGSYKKLADASAERAATLAPVEAERQQLVDHLARLHERGYKGRIEEQLRQERIRLNRIQELRRQFADRAAALLAQVEVLDRLIHQR